MATTFLNLIWNYYTERDGIVTYSILPNESKEMIATIEFKNEEFENGFLESLNREVNYELSA